jgi:phosphotriesterase-related protein
MMIQTVTGPVDANDLGRTLVHEHLLVSFPGAEFDPKAKFDRPAFVAEAVRRLTQLRVEHGVRTFVDPCPMEMGRDVRLMAEVSEKAQMNVVCCTGFYTEARGLPSYWRNSTVEQIAELYIHELEKGVGDTGIRPGAIKCASEGQPNMTSGEAKCLAAASIAQKATGVSIITHTHAGVGGPEQQDVFEENGLPLHRALIGHCCGSSDRAYQRGIAERGSYVGFDRIGLNHLQKDEIRADCLVDLFRAGHSHRILMSQDHWCCMLGRHGSPSDEAAIKAAATKGKDTWGPGFTHLFTDFVPMLIERGMKREEIFSILDDNPRRFFAGELAAA